MANEMSELEQRRAELTQSLPALSDNRANTYRRNSDALARATVTSCSIEQEVLCELVHGKRGDKVRGMHGCAERRPKTRDHI